MQRNEDTKQDKGGVEIQLSKHWSLRRRSSLQLKIDWGHVIRIIHHYIKVTYETGESSEKSNILIDTFIEEFEVPILPGHTKRESLLVLFLSNSHSILHRTSEYNKHPDNPKRRKPATRWGSYKQYLLSPEWSNIRLDLFQVRGKKCERCNSTYRLQIHHKTYENVFNEEPEDLEILCKRCHEAEHPHKVKSNNKKRKKRPRKRK